MTTRHAKSVVYHGTRWDKHLYVGYMCLFIALMAPFVIAPAEQVMPRSVLPHAMPRSEPSCR